QASGPSSSQLTHWSRDSHQSLILGSGNDNNATWVQLLRSERGGPAPGPPRPRGGRRAGRGRRAAACGGGRDGEGPGNGRRPSRVPAGRPLTPEEPHPCHIDVVQDSASGRERIPM